MSPEDRNLSLADRFLKETGQGKEPDMITQDLRFGLEARKKRLDRKGIRLHEEYVFSDDAVRGSRDMTPEDSPLPFHASMTFRETKRIREFSGLGKKTLRWEDPVTFYADIIDYRGREDFAVSCPSCGASFDAAHERNCPFCGSAYEAAGGDWVITMIRKE